MTQNLELKTNKSTSSDDTWLPGETIKPNGKVRMPPGIDITVYRSDLPGADELDPASQALVRNFPPPNPEAFVHLGRASGLIKPDSEAR